MVYMDKSESMYIYILISLYIYINISVHSSLYTLGDFKKKHVTTSEDEETNDFTHTKDSMGLVYF